MRRNPICTESRRSGMITLHTYRRIRGEAARRPIAVVFILYVQNAIRNNEKE